MIHDTTSTFDNFETERFYHHPKIYYNSIIAISNPTTECARSFKPEAQKEGDKGNRIYLATCIHHSIDNMMNR